MTSVLAPVSQQQQHHRAQPSVSKTKFRTVFGFATVARSPIPHHPNGNGPSPSLRERRSIDITPPHLSHSTYSYRSKKKKSRVESRSVTGNSFFEPDSATEDASNYVQVDTATPSVDDMKNIENPGTRGFRKGLSRVDNQDGPWTVSVAENPHDPRSYSLYIKTATHNLTLTRTSLEIVELHNKLREAQPSVKLPTLPIDLSSLPSPPPKRKSAFLNTLSRLASPSSSKSGLGRQASGSRSHVVSASSSMPSGATTPVASPSHEISDPFGSIPGAMSNGRSMPTGGMPPHPNSNVTALASYLNTIANDQLLRVSRPWKRFVRVRTDDLESVRVERAIKRVRSDLAAHVSPKTPRATPETSTHVSEAESMTESEYDALMAANATTPESEQGQDKDSATAREEDIKEEDETDTAAEGKGADGIVRTPRSGMVELPDAPAAQSAPATNGHTDKPGAEASATTKETHDHPSRIRSHSADPTSRVSKLYESPSFTSSGEAASSVTLGDASSVSTTDGRRRRKKRSRSSDPNKELKKKSQRKVVIDDFEMVRVLGKGCAGKVLLVRHKSTTDVYALKAITKRHVLAHQELQHTLTEQAVLKRMAHEGTDPFVVKLWWSFHDKENLFLVMDFHPGGDLATQLARWGRLGRDRARFYAAEIVEGVEGLHAAGVIYRDLKPENILIGADGHIVLTDFGLSKEFPRRSSPATTPSTPSSSRREFYSSAPGTPTPVTPYWMKSENGKELSGWPGQAVGQHDSTSTFCGTAEYLAPEVIQGLPYSYEVDWWSFGTMLYEMLTGITPFWANNHSDMYVRVLQDELTFPDDRSMDQDTKSLIRGLLQRNPALRICEPRIKKHPYFSMIDWSHVYYKRYIPPYIPPIDPSNASDTQNFDDTFLEMEPVINDPNDNDGTDTDRDREHTDATDGDDSVSTPLQSRSPSLHPDEQSVDVFDGYSFKGRHSVIIDGDDEASSEEVTSEEEEEKEEEEKAPIQEEEAPATLPAKEVAITPVTPEPEVSPLPKEPVFSQEPAEIQIPESPVAASPEPSIMEVPIAEIPDIPEPVEPKNEPEPPKPKESVLSRTGLTRPIARFARARREKSGIPALDKYLSDAIDEDTEATEREEDDDWDFVEAGEGEERNGPRGPTLFARGVRDRYILALRKGATPNRSTPRSVSTQSTRSDVDRTDPADSPTSEKQRRGRTPGLTFRKHPRQFLRPKSPPSSNSSRSVATIKTTSVSNSATVSSRSIASTMSPSSSSGAVLPMAPSLKSKESQMSVASSPGGAESMNGDAHAHDHDEPGPSVIQKSPSQEEPEKQKNKKYKKYKEGAEKVLSLFAAPR